MLFGIVRSRLAGALILASLSTGAVAQTHALTDQNYVHAEQFISYQAAPLVDHDVGRVHWLDDSHFVYTDHDANGDRMMQMDTATGQAAPLFDSTKLAASLNGLIVATGKPTQPASAKTAANKPIAEAADTVKPFDASKLGIGEVSLTNDGRYRFSVRGKTYICSADAKCSKASKAGGEEPGVLSPDKKSEAFIRDWNLWVRDVASGKETRLTTDGAKDFGYATDNAGWLHSDGAIVTWSPDSKKIATYQQDQRGVGEMATVSTRVGHPKVEVWKYPLPGDTKIFMIEPVVIDVAANTVVRLKMPPQQRLSSLCDDLDCDRNGSWDDAKWAPDSQSVAIVNSSRDRQHEWLRIANAQSGAVRTAFEDSVKTFYESGRGMVDWQYLPKQNQAIWFSEKTNWGNLYLIDLKTGKQRRAITTGEGTVAQVLHVDRDSRTLWFDATGRTPDTDPYYRQFWKVSIDGGKPTLLTPEKADHEISMSPDGKTFVDSYSTPTTPPVTVLRASSDGHVIATVARADISRLKAIGWVPPVPFTVKARDGKTTLYGMMFKPTDFDPSKNYPVIDYIYPGPQTGSVRGRSFLAGRGDNQAMAELGFIVVAIDGMGTPWRSKSFHDTWYGQMGDNTLPDQVAGIRELGKRYPWIDLDRVGIWGHSGGGNASADALFRYPDFFKVGWAESGNHDNRNYENDWGEKYQGLLKTNKDGSTNYDNQANQDLAKNLKGKLMLVHGSIDDNVPTGETLLVVDTLIKANKDFDMLIIPNAHHGYGKDTPYTIRRRWDYFVQNLMGGTPPHQFKMKALPER